MPLLLWVRHGETEDNRNLVFQGQGGSGLNARGRAQAQRLAARLAQRPPCVIVSSDLERAAETARILGAACGVVPTFDPGLREVDVGTWTGKSYRQVAEDFPEDHAALRAGRDVRRGGGETYAELAARMERTVAALLQRHEGRDRILLVSHGAAIRTWVGTVFCEGRPAALTALENASLTVVARDVERRLRLVCWNDTAHLEGLERA